MGAMDRHTISVYKNRPAIVPSIKCADVLTANTGVDPEQCSRFLFLMHQGSSTDIAIPARALWRMSGPFRLRRGPAPKRSNAGCTTPWQKATVMPPYVAPNKTRDRGAGGCFGVSTPVSHFQAPGRNAMGFFVW